MKQLAPRKLQYTERHGQMTAAHSIREFYDLVVELLTNSDDSYHAQYVEGAIPQDGGPILLEVEPRRRDARSVVRVRDRAGGFYDLVDKIAYVGARTSQAGDRGFMGRGLKDCAALGHITIETIIDGRLDKAEITPTFDLIAYDGGRKGAPATKADRARLGIARGNGTVIEVALEQRVRVPQLETLRRELPWHYALRDIMLIDGPSKVLLRYSGSEPEPLLCVAPDADVVYDREHEVPGYADRRFRFTLLRATKPLDDPSDSRFRRTGLLIKGRRAIHGCSFLTSELERDPVADSYFGRITCEDIDNLASEWDNCRSEGQPHSPDNPIFILDPNRRGGLAEEHPFVQNLFEIPAQVVKRQFEEDRAAREGRRKEVEAKETTERLRKLAREASRFMREKLEDLGVAAPGDVIDTKAFNKTGIGISPVFTQIPIGTTKMFVVKVNNQKLDLPPGTAVTVGLSKPAQAAVQLAAPAADLEVDPLDSNLLRGSFVLEGVAESNRVQVGCQVDGLAPIFVAVQVIPSTPVDRDIPNDFAFHRGSYSVRHSGRRTLLLRTTCSTRGARSRSRAGGLHRPRPQPRARRRAALRRAGGGGCRRSCLRSAAKSCPLRRAGRREEQLPVALRRAPRAEPAQLYIGPATARGHRRRRLRRGGARMGQGAAGGAARQGRSDSRSGTASRWTSWRSGTASSGSRCPASRSPSGSPRSSTRSHSRSRCSGKRAGSGSPGRCAGSAPASTRPSCWATAPRSATASPRDGSRSRPRRAMPRRCARTGSSPTRPSARRQIVAGLPDGWRDPLGKLDEVVHLVESPVVLEGGFDERFLALRRA